jgi:hypothetical protein
MAEMNLKSLLIFGCIFSACAKKPPHVKSCYDSAKAFVLVATRDFGVTPLGQGGFFVNGGIDSFYADFTAPREASEDEAKALLFSVTEKFLHHINGDARLKPFLNIYPLSMEHLSISIAFIDHEKSPQGALAQVHLYEGKIFYSHYDKEKKAYIAYRSEAFPLHYSLILK